jgi:hypothetical protein
MRHLRNSSYTGDRIEVICANCHEVLLRPAAEAATIPFFCSDMCKDAYDSGSAAIGSPAPGSRPARNLGADVRAIPRKAMSRVAQGEYLPGTLDHRQAVLGAPATHKLTKGRTPPPGSRTPEIRQFAAPDPDQYQRCPYCGVSVKAKRLETHKQTRCPRNPAHGTSPVAANPTRTARAPGSPTIREMLRARGSPWADLGGDQSARRRAAEINGADPRDASKGWAYAFRERGRFGSFPVHDGYSDESEP